MPNVGSRVSTALSAVVHYRTRVGKEDILHAVSAYAFKTRHSRRDSMSVLMIHTIQKP